MNLSQFIHAADRPSWLARMVVYIAFIVTISLLVQVLQVIIW